MPIYTKRRLLRIMIAFNAPPLLALVIFLVFLVFQTGYDESFTFKTGLVFVAMAYLFAGAQSLVFAFFMEFVVPGCTMSYRFFALAGGIIGFISGLIVALPFSFVGALIGALISLVLRYLHQPTQ